MKATHFSCAVAAAISASAFAQEAMYTAAGTMPGPGIMVFRQQLHQYRYGASVDQNQQKSLITQLDQTLQIGLAPEMSLTLDLPAEYANTTLLSGDREFDTTVPEVDAMFKWRFIRKDTGGIDTTRAAIMIGARTDLEDGVNVDPHIGVVFTQVIERHGWNAELHFTHTTGGVRDRLDNTGGEGTADALRLNLAYVYRIEPAAYTSESTGAWYITTELNSIAETNGDKEVRFSPGLMFEGRKFGFELMAQVPLWNNLDRRAELDWAIGIGWRLLF